MAERIGTSGADSLYGTDGADLIRGEGGDDLLVGHLGADTIYGGTGNDNINGYPTTGGAYSSWKAGPTLALGEDGNDFIIGGEFNDSLIGGLGNDTLYGGTGNDSYLGGDGDDYLYDSGGDNYFDGGAGNDTVYGDSGTDIIVGGIANDSLIGWTGNDKLDGGSGDDYLSGGDGNDVYYIDSRGDRIYDSGGSNDQAIVSASWVKIPSTIERVTYTAGSQELPYWISALVADEASGDYYKGLLNSTKTYFFTFPNALPSYDKSAEHAIGFTAFNATQKSNTKTALSYIGSVVDLQFLETNSADQRNTLSFALNTQTGSSGYARYPSDSASGSDVFLNNRDYNATLNSGTDGAQTLIHEIGHALGLKHPFD
ncbi:MAG: hypothetical protein EBV34_20670, partial [Betaproteobacteria bacterium]|nr:hypothetical protein [Betaproteobacteria bacterium]